MDTRLIAKNAAALGISGVLAKAITAVVGIFVTRYLGPGPYGDYSSAYAFVGTIILFAELGLSQLMVQDCSRDPSALPGYFGNTLLVKAIVSVLCFIVMVIFMFPAGYNDTVKAMIVILGVAVCFNAMNQSVYNYYQAVQKLYLAAGFQFLTTFIIAILTLAVIIAGKGVVSITVTHLITYILISILIALALKNEIRPRIDLASVFPMIRRGLAFGIHRLFYNTFSQLSILVLSLTVSNVEVGIYSAAYKLVLMLIFLPSLATSALYPILYQLGEKDKRSHMATTEKVFKVLSGIGIPGSVLIFVLSEPIIHWLYAGKFDESIPILMVVAWFFALECISFSLGDVLTTTNHQWQRTMVQGSALVLLFVLIMVLTKLVGLMGAAYALIIVEGYIFLSYYILVRRGVYKIRIWRQLPLIIFASLIMAGIAWPVKGLNPFIAAVLAGIVYCCLLVAFDRDFRKIGKYLWNLKNIRGKK
ncbi:MAG: flippase [Peptococcaceae bacterium]|nr:flippase [Peptococcaceae bacterium]